jgi:hypothetical protein
VSNDEALSGPFTDAALTLLAQGFAPIPVKGKHPVPQLATGKDGIVDGTKVDSWLSDPEWAGQNVAIRAEGFIGIDVDDYGDKHGAQQLEELEAALGPLPATISSTSRGPGKSRIYFFEVPAEAEERGFIGKASPDVDIIQKSHRFAVVAPSWHPVTAEQYQWYTADGEPYFDGDIPSPSDFERLPEAWLDFLDKGRQQKAAKPGSTPIRHEGFGGTIAEWLSTTQQGLPSAKVNRWIARIPETDFGHDEMLSLAAALIHLGAEGHAGIKQGLDALWDAWTRPPYESDDYARELTVAVQGAIKKFGAQRPTPESLPDFMSAQAYLGQNIPKELQDLIFEGDDLVELLDALAPYGLDVRDAAAIAWRSKASKDYRDDFAGFWDIVSEHRAPINASTDQAPRSEGSGIRFSLLSDEERAKVSGMENWVTRYIDWAKTMLPDGFLNEPYHRAAAWTAMSLFYGPGVRLVNNGKMMPCNLWFFVIGESSTGKNDAMDLMFLLADEVFGDKNSYAIGSRGSPVAIHRQLIEMDGRPALLESDEIAGQLKKWIDPDDRAWGEMADSLTSWYEGRVPPLQRATAGQGSTEGADAHLSAFLMGTPARLLPVLTTEAFAMGFLARALWAVGNPAAEELDWDYTEGSDHDGERAPMSVVDWGTQIRAEARSHEGAKMIIRTTPQAKQRMTQAGRKVVNLFRRHQNSVALEPASRRLMNNVRKAAGLLAATRGDTMVNEDDVLYVLSHAEHWLKDVEWVAAQTAATPHRRLMDVAMRSIRAQKRTDVSLGVISKALGLRMNEVRQIMESLVIEGSVKQFEEGDTIFYRRIKKEGEA